MTDTKKSRHHGKRTLLTGLVALLPIVITLIVVKLLWTHVLEPISRPIGDLILQGVVRFTPVEFPPEPPAWAIWSGKLAALILAVIAVYFLGLIITTVIGRKLLRLGDHILIRVPFINTIYPYAKQLSDFLFGERKVKFSRVVAIEYPRKGIYSLGFVTSRGPERITEYTGKPMLAVFIPTSPTPITGWVVTLPADEVIDLKMNVDEAVRFTVTCGVLAPGKQQLVELPELAARQKPGETHENKSEPVNPEP